MLTKYNFKSETEYLEGIEESVKEMLSILEEVLTLLQKKLKVNSQSLANTLLSTALNELQHLEYTKKIEEFHRRYNNIVAKIHIDDSITAGK